MRERFLLTRLIADELRLYASVLGTQPRETLGMFVGLTGEQRDPVCGMRVLDSATARHLEYDSHDYFFCSRTCEDEFAHDPGRFLRAVPLFPNIREARHWFRRLRRRQH